MRYDIGTTVEVEYRDTIWNAEVVGFSHPFYIVEIQGTGKEVKVYEDEIIGTI